MITELEKYMVLINLNFQLILLYHLIFSMNEQLFWLNIVLVFIKMWECIEPISFISVLHLNWNTGS